MRILSLTVVFLIAATAAGAAGSPSVVAKVPIPGGVQPCAAAAGGRWVWVSLYASPVLLKIDPRKNAVVGRTDIGFGSCGLGFGAGSLWIEDTNSSTVSRVSVRTAKRTAAVKVGSTPYDATFAYGAAWVTSYGVGELGRIDPSRNRVVKRFPLMLATGVIGAFGSVWAAGAEEVIRVDPQANRVIARIPLSSGGWTAASADAVWVTTFDGLVRIDPATNEIVATVPIVGPLGDPAVVAGQVWVPQIRKNRIVIVDPDSNAMVRTVKVGSGPFVVTEIRGEAWIPSWNGTDIWRLRP